MAELADALDSGSSRGNSVEVQVLLAAMKKLVLFALFIGNAFAVSVSPQVAEQVGVKIWKNECGGTLEGLTHWGKNENFPSLASATSSGTLQEKETALLKDFLLS